MEVRWGPFKTWSPKVVWPRIGRPRKLPKQHGNGKKKKKRKVRILATRVIKSVGMPSFEGITSINLSDEPEIIG